MKIKCNICENFTVEMTDESNYQCKTCGVVFSAKEIEHLEKGNTDLLMKNEPFKMKKPNFTKKTVVLLVSGVALLIVVSIVLSLLLKDGIGSNNNNNSQPESIVSEGMTSAENNFSKIKLVNGTDYGGAFEKELTVYNATDKIIVFDLYYYRLWGAERVVANIDEDGKAYFKTEDGVEGTIKLSDKKASVCITKSNGTYALEETIEYLKIEKLKDMVEGVVDIRDFRGTPFGVDFFCSSNMGLDSDWDSEKFLVFSDMEEMEANKERTYNFIIHAPFESDKSAADITKNYQLFVEDGSSVPLENIIEIPVQIENETIGYYRECKTKDDIHIAFFASKSDKNIYQAYFIFANSEVYNANINLARAIINSLEY